MIRIIGGLYRHRLINQPPLEITRATKDAAKEGLFNSLGDINGLSFLDLYSGSGSIGVEAFSRGATKVFLNDNNREVKRTIMRNLMALGISDINVTCLEDTECIKELTRKGLTFDIVFLDPPYVKKISNDFLENMYQNKIVNDSSRIIIESDDKLVEGAFESYDIKVLKYGKTFMNILRRK